MAKTMAIATGYDSSRTKSEHRLGSRGAKAQAQTWQTFATAYVGADGSGYVQVADSSGRAFHRFDFGPESERVTA